MQTYFNLMGFEFVADVDWTLTYRGCPAKLYGPPENCYPAEDPEWEINSIILHLDNGGNNFGPGFEATGALFLHPLLSVLLSHILPFRTSSPLCSPFSHPILSYILSSLFSFLTSYPLS